MRWYIALAILVLMSGCASNVCIDKLALTPDRLVNIDEHGAIRKLPVAMDKSLSVEGNMHALTVYDQMNGSYYVRFTPLQFATEKIYGPFEGVPEEDLRCE